MSYYKKNKTLRKTHNYKPEMEHDACGVGLIASTNGKKSRKAANMESRLLKLFGIEVQLMLTENLEMGLVYKLK